MGVRPPSNDGKEPESIEFGIAAVDARLKESTIRFPATSDEVIDALDGEEIPYDARGRSVSIATALDETDKQRFETRQELLNTLHFVFEDYRERKLGVIDQMRSLLPF